MRNFFTFLLVVFIFGCNQSGTVENNKEVIKGIEIEIVGSESTLEVGDALSLKVLAVQSDNNKVDITKGVKWESDNLNILNVSKDGVVKGVNPGVGIITARYLEFSKEQVIKVELSPIISINIALNESEVKKGNSLQLKLFGKDKNDNVFDVTSDAIWLSETPDVLSVSKQGLISGIKLGNARVKASYLGLSSSVSINVIPSDIIEMIVSPVKLSLVSGGSHKVVAEFVHEDKSKTKVKVFDSITSSSQDVVVIEDNHIKGIGGGNAKVTVKATEPSSKKQYTKEISVSVTEPITLISLEINPSLIELGTRTTKRISVNGVFSDGKTQDFSDKVSWIIDDLSIAKINKGILHGLRTGKTNIQVNFGATYSSKVPIEVRELTVSSSYSAFSALKADKSVISWGEASYGGYSKEIEKELKNIKQIKGANFGFAALSDNGNLVSWGTLWDNGQYFMAKNIKEVVADPMGWSFAAITMDGRVMSWGHNQRGGDSSLVADKLTDIKKIYPIDFAYAALKNDGTVVTWGHPLYGGDSSAVNSNLTNVVDIFSNGFAFAALKNDGTVVTWGDPLEGGDSSKVSSKLTDVKKVFSNNVSFAALKNDGSIVTWGMPERGGDSSLVQSQLKDIVQVYSNDHAYAAVKSNGDVVTWGHPSFGGNSSYVQSDLKNIRHIQGNRTAFAAIDDRHNVITWGADANGGDSSSVTNLLHNVEKVVSTTNAFAALKQDGTVVSWGDFYEGGWSEPVQSQLYDILDIYSTLGGAFAAIRKDGKLFTWGQDHAGGNYSNVSLN
ncbi:hypothetical protein VP758_004966 [Vibrio harveyi]|nr:hypothetical protein [Vibrio harveyi]